MGFRRSYFLKRPVLWLFSDTYPLKGRFPTAILGSGHASIPYRAGSRPPFGTSTSEIVIFGPKGPLLLKSEFAARLWTAMFGFTEKRVAYGYRRLWAKLRRAGYVVNRKRVQRLLRLWGYGLTRPRPHPKPRGVPSTSARPINSGRPT
jgi:HTH-like domain